MLTKKDQFDFQPVIIIGAARSGTNMLRDALSELTDVATWPCDEINAIWRYRRAAVRTDAFLARHATDEIRHYVRNTFRKLANRRGAQWVVEKTCANSLRVDFVRTIVPESKFLFLVRAGRAVVASALKRWHSDFDIRYTANKARFVPFADAPAYAIRIMRSRLHRLSSTERRLKSWGPRFVGIDRWLTTRSLAEVCAQQWSRCVLRALASLSRLPAEKVCLISYESFVAQPAEELRRVAEFLSIPHCSEQIRRLAANISCENVNKWRQDLSLEDTARIDPIVSRTWQCAERTMPQLANVLGNVA